VLGHAAAGYLLTGDSTMGRIVEQFCKGVAAHFKCMVWDTADSVGPIMARAFMPANHSVAMPGGRQKRIDYSPWYRKTRDWNSHTIRIRNNPYWGDIWVKNMRSKDDLPHLFWAAVFVGYVAKYGASPEVRSAAAETYGYLVDFARDIVDHGYTIRTRDENGRVFVPEEDLANFVAYDRWSRRGECAAKLTVSLLGYGETRGNHCRSAYCTLYDRIAPRIHYFNLAMVRGFHLTAVLNAANRGYDRVGRMLANGLVARAREVHEGFDEWWRVDRDRWDAEGAVFLVQAAAAGLPLTADDIVLIHREFGDAIDEMARWPYWDLWDESVPDGVYEHRPEARVPPEDIGIFMEYCFSPLRGNGPACVDCDIVRDPRRW
jgi:hypothetical protein